jgi:NitT/TauT family transport system substrate-binding protein
MFIAAGCPPDTDVGGDAGTTAAPQVGETDPGAGADDDGEVGRAEGELTPLTATIPFPSCVVFYPLYVAEDRGYFAEEGLTVTVEAVDGSGAVLQALLSDRADIGLPSPGPFLQAVNEGADLRSFYTLFQSNVFALVTLAGSEIASLEDLRGTTIGVGTIDGGEVPFVKAMLAEEAGLTDADYELLAVGDGGTAAVALQNGQVAAYAAAFPDVAIMRLQGLELRDLISEEFQSFFDSLLVARTSMLEEQPEVIEGVGRAVARATQWGFDNPDQVVDVTSKFCPEEAQDEELTRAFLNETIRLFELPPEADGRFGYAVPEHVERYVSFLVEQGELDEAPDTSVFVNDFVDAYNDF